MKSPFPKKNLFSTLSESPWWLSLLVALALLMLGRLFLPDLAAIFSTVPFLGIAAYSAWKQWRVPGEKRIAQTMQDLRDIPWERFSLLVSEAFRHEGCTVTALDGRGGDFLATKEGRISLVSCKRWKVAQTGIGPLRELHDARLKHDAGSCIYIAAGDFTDNARAYATEKSIQLLSGPDLTVFIGKAGMPILPPRP